MTTLSKGKQFVGLIGWIAITALLAAIGAWGSMNAPVFYQSLNLPSFAPPSTVFGPVWSILYLLMGIAAWLVWRERDGFHGARSALVLYLIQLVVNAMWSWAFFNWHNGMASLLIIAALWLLIVVMLIQFWRIKPLAGILLLPYLAWVSFATFLTYSVWHLNPTLL
jgi:tryptophan-rich sensory protein